MGYSVYEQKIGLVVRWAGYGVPAECDLPGCTAQIDRGLGYVCEESEAFAEVSLDGEETSVFVDGCGLFFCAQHQDHTFHGDSVEPKGESVEWLTHILNDPSWALWRSLNPESVEAYREQVSDFCPDQEDSFPPRGDENP